MIKNYISYFILAMILFSGCLSGHHKNTEDQLLAQADSVYQPLYANLFKIQYFKDHKLVEVRHPWESTALPLKTILSDDSLFLAHHPEAIEIPLKKWISVASTQICYANELNVLNSLVGMAEPEYVSNPYVVNGIQNGSIRNIGTAFAPDMELIMSLNPDMMMVSPFKDDYYGILRNAGINVVTNSSYLENSPLGRVEWLVFVAAFFNKEKEAVAKLNDISSRYLQVKAIAQKAKNKPTVFTGKPYQGIWYVPAAESYKAHFFKDAGVQYAFAHCHGNGSLNYDFETVYQAAAKCDYWSLLLNYNGLFSYSVLKEMDPRYSDFDAFKNRNIIYSNTANSMYYEEGLIRPDVILSDMVKLFHPELLKDYSPVFYKKLTKE